MCLESRAFASSLRITSTSAPCRGAPSLNLFDTLRRTRWRKTSSPSSVRRRAKAPCVLLVNILDYRLISTLSQEDLYEYCTRTRRTIREVMDDFHSIRLPRNYVFDVFPLMRPRLFSIASSLLVRTLLSSWLERRAHCLRAETSATGSPLRRHCPIQDKAPPRTHWRLYVLPRALATRFVSHAFRLLTRAKRLGRRQAVHLRPYW
jgi:hypothetical protein